MSSPTRKFAAGIALLLIGLSLVSAVHLPAPHTARANPGVLYAAPAAQGNGDCSSWENACTLQAALAQAISGDEIWVKMGVHYSGAAGERAATFALKNGVATYGGFAGTESSREERDWQANFTVLSGDIDHNDITDPHGVVTTTAHIQGANSYHVVTINEAVNFTILDGFIITAGQASEYWPNHAGGGVYDFYSKATLGNIVFSGNMAHFYGGGMYTENSQPTLVNVTFRGNAAKNGGGMHNYGSRLTLSHATFRDNTASDFGGGMYNQSVLQMNDATFIGNSAYHGGGMFNWGGTTVMTNIVFSGNTASRRGGGMYNYLSSTPTLINVTFTGNTGGAGGGGMVNHSSSSPTLINATFGGNTSPVIGGGMYNSDNSNPILTNVVMWGDSAPERAEIYNADSVPAISHSDVQGCGGSDAWDPSCGADGGGNIDADPLFLDAAGGNLRLQLPSPAIDAGDNAALPISVTFDLDGRPRFVDIPTVPDAGSGTPPLVDMGAYEAQYMDVALGKAVLPPTAAPGQAITFALHLSNTGSLPVAGIVLTDTLPAWLWGVSFTATLGVTDTGQSPPYVWLVQCLAPGQSGVITVSGVLSIPLAAGTYTNTASISATGDLLAENNAAAIALIVPNVAPRFTSAPPVTATQDAPYTYTARAGDDNGDALTITAPTLPPWLTLQDHGGGAATLSGTPTNAEVGDHPVTLLVADGGGQSATQSFTVTVANVNDAPSFTSTPVITAAQGAPYAYAVAAADPDLVHGDILTITAPILPPWLTLQDHGGGAATLSGAPPDAGEHPVVLRVADRAGAFAEQAFVITVAPGPRYDVYVPLVFKNGGPSPQAALMCRRGFGVPCCKMGGIIGAIRP